MQCPGRLLSGAVGVWPPQPQLHCGLQEEDPEADHWEICPGLGRPEALHTNGPQTKGHPPSGHPQVHC